MSLYLYACLPTSKTVTCPEKASEVTPIIIINWSTFSHPYSVEQLSRSKFKVNPAQSSPLWSFGWYDNLATVQFGTEQFGTKIVKTDNLAARRQKGHFGTKIRKRTIWHQHSENGQFGTNIIKRAIWHRNFIGINFIEIDTKNVRVVLFIKNFQKV